MTTSRTFVAAAVLTLGLTPGRHRLEIRAPGYQTVNFDVDVVAGEVIPYQGVMQR